MHVLCAFVCCMLHMCCSSVLKSWQCNAHGVKSFVHRVIVDSITRMQMIAETCNECNGLQISFDIHGSGQPLVTFVIVPLLELSSVHLLQTSSHKRTNAIRIT